MTATEALGMLQSDSGMGSEYGNLLSAEIRKDTTNSNYVEFAINGRMLDLTPGEAIGIGKALEALGKRASGKEMVP